MDKLNFSNKQNGDLLNASEWNSLASKVDEIVDEINTETGGTDPHIVFDTRDESNPTGKSNLTLLTTAEDLYLDGSKTKGGKINIEPISDLQIKAGDDVSFYAHHRAVGDKDQVGIKILTEASDEKDIPAKLKLNSGDITISNADNVLAIMVEIKETYKKTPDYILDTDFPADTFENGYVYKESVITSKLSTVTTAIKNDILGMGVGKTRVLKYNDGTTDTFYKFTKVSNSDGVTNVNIEDTEGFGYLKVRAQSIDLRCEEHGGIALQPKGFDGNSNMNKIKFEHGGGDGLEFGTFNTEKSSLFTKEYRFNKDGKILLATRTTEASDKADASDSTTSLKYVKLSDDFYDVIYEGETGNEFYNYDPTTPANDTSVTWEDLIKFIAWAKANAAGSAWENLWPQNTNL